MKTTVDVPDVLLLQAKIAAVRRRTTLKHLIVQGLEYIAHASPSHVSESTSVKADDAFFEADTYGIPVLKHRGVTVTNELIERMREQEGI